MPPEAHPVGLPHLFVDRSLGRIQVPALLRAAGLHLTTLSELYGVPADESIGDVQWLTDAGARGWAVLMKDDRIRYRAAERAALRESGVRGFVLPRGNLRAADTANRFLGNIDRLAAACAEPGPFLYTVHENRIDRLRLDD